MSRTFKKVRDEASELAQRLQSFTECASNSPTNIQENIGVKSKYEMKDGEGSLFKNDKRAKDTDPDVNGSARIGGVDYAINGWKKNSKSGLSYMKLSLCPKSEVSGKAKPAFNDDVGF
jgi:hypothetical protein